MQTSRFFLFFLFLIPFCGLMAQDITFSGFVSDSETGEALIGATLFSPETSKGTVSNKYGFFSLSLPPGNNSLRVSYVGYQSQTLAGLKSDSLLRIRLKSNIVLGEITVQGNRAEQILASPEMGVNRLQAKQIEKMPVLLGESDVLKAVQMLPGVNSGGEGTSGISVRGGSPDQTLILLDDVPVYNVNHLFGYFSVFNSQAIHGVELIKGAIPARYGGRLSSVLDISMKEGNNQQFKADVSIGTMAARGTIEGPIAKGKGSYMLSARKTWPDLFLRLYHYYAESEMRMAYGFYDLNGKANWRFSDSDRIYLSFYTGRDKFSNLMNYNTDPSKYEDSFYWGNYTGSFRWNHVFGPKLFSNLTAYYSRYGYTNINETTPKDKTKTEDYWLEKFNSVLNDFSLKMDFDYRPSNAHTIRYGISLSHKSFQPEVAIRDHEGTDSILNPANANTGQIAELYAEDIVELSPTLRANLGLRASLFYDGTKLNPYLMPRISVAYRPFEKVSFKAGYSRMVQHVHQLTNSSLSFPTDLWVTSIPELPSSQANLFSVGTYYIPDQTYAFTLEIYYSGMKNVISYYPGIDYLAAKDKSWHSIVMQGNGKAYGIELMAEKKQGKLTGFVNYTYSRSLRSFTEIYNGKYFAYEYDKPHKVAALINYDFQTRENAKYRKSLSASFTYSSGRLISLATAKHQVSLPPSINIGNEGYYGDVYYTPRPNNFRMNSFHHLDISFQLESLRKDKGSWTFGVYNIYNQFNASHYNFVDNKIFEVATFPIMPFVSWSKKY